jgi:hypothetical protein
MNTSCAETFLYRGQHRSLKPTVSVSTKPAEIDFHIFLISTHPSHFGVTVWRSRFAFFSQAVPIQNGGAERDSPDQVIAGTLASELR